MNGLRKILGLASCAAMVSVTASSASAELLAYEPFAYAPDTVLQGQAGGTGWLTPWDVRDRTRPRLIVEGTGLSYLDLQVTGNSLGNSLEGGELAARTFTGAPITGSVYFSFLVNGDANTSGEFGALLRPSNDSNGPGAIGVQELDSLDGTDGFDFSANRSTVDFFGNNPGGTSIVGTNLLVVQYDYDTNEATYWANPTALGGPAPIATLSGIAFTDPTLAVDEFVFQYASGDSVTAVFDEFRVGTTFASVTPVPEPASLALLGLGGLLMVPRRKQR